MDELHPGRYRIANGFRSIPEDHVYFIAEAGNNHNGEVDLARKMIDLAVECGADAVKFQKRDIDSMLTVEYLDRPFSIPGIAGEEWGHTYRKVREHIELDMEEFELLKNHCGNQIDFIVTPFDLLSVRQLEELGVDAYKVASFTVTDIPVLEEVARTGKSVFVSTGVSTDEEIRDAVQVLRSNDLILMHCVSSYPMKPKDANLRMIHGLKKFGSPVGWSDHEVGIALSAVAVALGARAVERHFTLDRSLPGFDHVMSLEPQGLRKVIRDIRKVEVALQGATDRREILPCELKAFEEKRRTVVSTQLILKGQQITRAMLTTKGPNRGLSPKMIPEIVGKEALEEIPPDTHITFSMVKF